MPNGKEKKRCCFFSPCPFFQTISIGKFTIQSIHPKPRGASRYIQLFNWCGLSANLYIHWLKTHAIVYELLYFDVFKRADKRVWQLLKDFKHDKEFHDVTIKSKTLICHFNQNTSVRSSIHPSIKSPKWVQNDQKGYEMTWVRIDHHKVISYPVELGT